MTDNKRVSGKTVVTVINDATNNLEVSVKINCNIFKRALDRGVRKHSTRYTQYTVVTTSKQPTDVDARGQTTKHYMNQVVAHKQQLRIPLMMGR